MKNGGNLTFAVRDEDFVKSSFSKNNPKTCVMVARTSEGVALRDSKDPEKNTQFYTHDEWNAFIEGVRNGEFS
jgi:hypothetical protein